MSFAIMAHPRRTAQAERLAALLGAEIIWDRGLGENDTGDQAWQYLADNSKDEWLTVIQDDAQPIPDFINHHRHALEHRPNDAEAFSWYLGTSRPPQWQRRVKRAINTLTDAAWFVCPQLLHGVAVTLHQSHVPPMLQFVKASGKAYDFRIGHYLRDNRIPVYYPTSSLVEHADTDSLLGHDKAPRKAHRLGAPEWNQNAAAI